MMKQSLQLKLGQQLTMTPQLQQAIRLLQLSTLELQLEVQQVLDSNVMLELAEDEDGGADNEPQAGESAGAERELELERPGQEIPDELPVDSVWDDIYEPVSSAPALQGEGEDREFEYGDTAQTSLREHLQWQLDLSSMSETDRMIAETIIDAINDDGFLSLSLEEVLENFTPSDDIEPDEVEAVLHAVQNFDPPGVAARDLRESLQLQLRQLPPDTPWREAAQELIEEYFDLLANRDYTQIRRRMNLDEPALHHIIGLIQALNPRPGSQISNQAAEYIIPDVLVRKHKGRWRVELNPEASPRLRVNETYSGMLKQVNNASETVTLRNHLQEARWFIKSLQSRNETLLKVASAIVEHQRAFLEQGEVAMKALVLHDIAQEVGMHESTISRVTTKKYMHTPRGIFELKYFFSSHVGTASGGECSSTAIRALIKNLIAEENPAKPLSDNKIAGTLSEQGINVARRTVAKYREAMAIPPSNERKRLA